MKLTKHVAVTVVIETDELVGLLTRTLYPRASAAEGEERTLFRALSNLVGCSDVEAIKIANKWADSHDCPRVKVGEFRRWLPTILSEAFDGYMKGDGR